MLTKKRIIVFVMVALLITCVILFRPVVYMFGLASMFAYLLYPLMSLFERKGKIKRWIAVTLTMVVALLVCTGIAAMFLPILFTQAQAFIHDLPTYSKKALEYLGQADQLLSQLGIEGGLINNIEQLVISNSGKIGETIAGLLSNVAGVVVGVSSGIINTFFVLMLVVYFLHDGKQIVEGFVNLFNDTSRPIVQAIFAESNHMVWSYLKMKLILAGGMALVTCIGFMLIGLDNAFLFAFIAFVLDFIPYIGSILGGVLPALIALLSDGWMRCVMVTVFVVIVQQIQGNVLSPKFQADSVGIHPTFGIFALLACDQIWGGIGMLIAVPIAGFIQITAKHIRKYYLTLKEDSDEPQQDITPKVE